MGTTRRASLAFGAAAIGAALSFAPPARAQTDGALAVVVEGKDADEVSAAIVARAASHFDAADGKTYRAALARSGAPTTLAAAASNRARGKQMLHRAYEAVGKARIDAAILVSAQKDARGTRLHVWAVDAHVLGGSVEREVAVPADAPPETAADMVWRSVAEALGVSAEDRAPPPAAPAPAAPRASPPPAPPAAAPELAPDAAPEPAAPAPRSSPPSDAPAAPPLYSSSPRDAARVIVGASTEGGTRHFSYVDRVTGSLRPYTLGAAPLVALSVELHPLARASSAALRGLGVDASYARAIGVTSRDSAGSRVGTSWQSFEADVVERVPVTRALVVGAHAGIVGIDFDFDQAALSSGAAALPSVGYRAVRVGPDARATLGALSAFGGGSYMGIVSTGALGGMFPKATAGGIEAHAGVGWAFARALEATLAVSYTRVFYTMNPAPGDAYVAGGALDELTRLSAGLAYLW